MICVFIGPFTPVAADCTLGRCEVEYSVLMERCQLRDVPRMEGSLLGRDVRISRTERRPAAHRFLLGDHADIEITEGRL